jgi:hypothetical protein
MNKNYIYFALMGAIAFAAGSLFLSGTAFAQGVVDPNARVAAAVRSYFADVPVMIAIAKCESGPRQFNSDGTPLMGGTGTMGGVFQFDETVHHTKALSLGFDINTLAGNLAYARYLYGASGTNPWISSFGCWRDDVGKVAISSVSTSTGIPVLTHDLALGETDPQVLILQRYLNNRGFILASSGPGSPGNETMKFGVLTNSALKKFQCAQGIACSGEEATTGYGLLNSATRIKLLAADDPTEIAQLESRISSLLAVVSQLQATIAARAGH